MKKRALNSIILILAAGVSACGGSGSDSGGGTITVAPRCELRRRRRPLRPVVCSIDKILRGPS